jgi:hypothetical protein
MSDLLFLALLVALALAGVAFTYWLDRPSRPRPPAADGDRYGC